MMRSFVFLALLVFASPTGCATQSVQRQEEPLMPTLHEIGDTAHYRFEGSELPSPVTVDYSVVRTDGARVTFEVRMRRASEELVWRQTLLDTRENRERINLESIELPGEEGWVVENRPSTSRVAELYAWTLPGSEFLQKGTPFPYSSSALIRAEDE